MRKQKSDIPEKLWYVIDIVIICVCANSHLLATQWKARKLGAGAGGSCFWWYAAVAAVFILANVLPAYSRKSFPNRRMKVCNHGVKCLKIFGISTVVSVVYHIASAFSLFPGQWKTWLISAIACFCLEAVVFWNGMISVYATSLQLGIRTRILGIVCGFIPIAHLIMLYKIIRVTAEEVRFETEKHRVNLERRDAQVCHTKYPILLVHGVFFRDSKRINYWGRIPEELAKNGAEIYYGNQQSALPVADSAAELAGRIRKIAEETGCEKLNVIAHSKGGLDIRYAIAKEGVASYIASVTTVSTPHRGCEFADYLLTKIPGSVQQKIAGAYDGALRKFGETPDFLSAVRDLTAKKCKREFDTLQLPEGIYSASVGSKLAHATDGKFPLNFSYPLVKHFDGPNDGLVGEPSFRWGENYTFLTTSGRRGISHGDMIDLNRENIPGFDVREFYVQLVHDLKRRGL